MHQESLWLLLLKIYRFIQQLAGCKYARRDDIRLCCVMSPGKEKKLFFFFEQKSVIKSNRKSIWWCVSLGNSYLLFPKNRREKKKKKRVSSSDLFSVVQIRKKKGEKKNVYFVILLHLRLYVSKVMGRMMRFLLLTVFLLQIKRKKNLLIVNLSILFKNSSKRWPFWTNWTLKLKNQPKKK